MDSTDEGEWNWIVSPRAERQFDQLDVNTQQQIVSKLDDVVSSEWRDPEDFLEQITNSPFQKLRIGNYRLGCRLMKDDYLLRVESIRKREGAYQADD